MSLIAEKTKMKVPKKLKQNCRKNQNETAEKTKIKMPKNT